MLVLIFLLLIGVISWTISTLMRDGPNNDDIQSLLKQMGADLISFSKILIKLTEGVRSLLILLKDSEKKLEPKKKSSQLSDSPKLIELKNNKEKKAA